MQSAIYSEVRVGLPVRQRLPDEEASAQQLGSPALPCHRHDHR